jgi:aminotransferase
VTTALQEPRAKRAAAPPLPPPAPDARIAAHVRDIPRSGIRDFFDLVASARDVISLGIGEPDFDTPWRVREAAMYALERGTTHYTSNLGMPRLREALAGYVASAFHVAYDPAAEVIVTVGVSEAMDLAVRAICSIPATR